MVASAPRLGDGPTRDDRGMGTLRSVKSSVEALEGNKVKVTVEVEASEFEIDLDAAFKRLAKEIKLPGFRPGKAPRKVLEARIGGEYARQEAFREGLPSYYVEAVKEHEVDVIGPPEFDITAGQDSGAVVFDVVVEVRPSVTVSGYEALEVEIPNPQVSAADVDGALDRMRGQFGTLETVERPAEEGDRVVIDIRVIHEGEPVEGLTADDYLYQVGMGAVVPELDEQITGASAGDELIFAADHPDEEEEVQLEFTVTVKEVQATVLPEVDDEFAKANSEFETAAALRADFEERMGRVRVIQAVSARRNAVAEAVAELVPDDELPEALIALEVENRAQDLAMRLQAQGLSLNQYMQFTGTSREDMLGELRGTAVNAAKLDLALRAVAAAEGLEASETELDEEFARVSEQVNRSLEQVRSEFAAAGQLPAVRSDLEKSKALDWLVERSKPVDDEGNAIEESLLVLPEEPEHDDDHDHHDHDHHDHDHETEGDDE